MIIDGKAVAEQIQNELKEEIRHLKGRKPCLAVVLIGDHPPSQIYISRKTQACSNIGMLSIKKQFPATITENAFA